MGEGQCKSIGLVVMGWGRRVGAVGGGGGWGRRVGAAGGGGGWGRRVGAAGRGGHWRDSTRCIGGRGIWTSPRGKIVKALLGFFLK